MYRFYYVYNVYLYLYVCCAHLDFVRFEHSVCRGSLMTTYKYIYIEIDREI